MSAQRKAKIRRLAQKRFENVCNRCNKSNLWWQLNDDKWVLVSAESNGQSHECKEGKK